MPLNEEHCRISLLRTGKDFRELHTWVDEPHIRLGKKHRAERHDSTWVPEVVRLFGIDAIKEFFHHIFVDFRDSENQWLEIPEEPLNEKEFIDYQYVFTCSKCACHAHLQMMRGKLCIRCLNYDRDEFVWA